MKKTLAIAIPALILTVSCQSAATKKALEGQQLAEEAIAIHDEIMPQVSVFDKTGLHVDSLLNNMSAISANDSGIDTASLRSDLVELKSNLEDATDFMMTWMYEYQPDSTDVDYQKSEVEKVKKMKKQFEEVAAESKSKLAPFNL